MTLAKLLSDLYDSLSIPEARADAPPEEKTSEDKKYSDDSKDSDNSDDDKKTPEESDDEPKKEEEEEEEPEDIMPKIQEECENSKQCAPFKHHYEECAERVQKWEEADDDDDKKGKKENCVEEYFHLMHCAGNCVAPKLFPRLK